VVEIRKGLQGGELIVRGGQEKLQDGQPVEVEPGEGGRGAKP
jgi:hypothetical protein